MNGFSLRMLRTFVMVAECGTISTAAKRLARSQAAVSETISELEAALGLPIFLRKPAKGLVLTPTGETLVLEARSLLAHADEFSSIAGAMGNALEGELSVACFVNLAPVVFARLVAEFGQRYPKIKVRMLIGNHEEILQSMRSGASELALTFDLAMPEQFRAITLAKLPPLAVLSKNHRLARSKRVSLHDLAAEPLVLMDLPHTREYFLSLFYSLNVEPRIEFLSNSFETVRTLVGNDLGYSLLNVAPKVGVTYDGGEIVNVPIVENLRPLHIALFTLRRISQRRVSRTFSDFTRGFFKTWRDENGYDA
jgi:DNA-binding transcriptional LysR family regulator